MLLISLPALSLSRLLILPSAKEEWVQHLHHHLGPQYTVVDQCVWGTTVLCSFVRNCLWHKVSNVGATISNTPSESDTPCGAIVATAKYCETMLCFVCCRLPSGPFANSEREAVLADVLSDVHIADLDLDVTVLSMRAGQGLWAWPVQQRWCSGSPFFITGAGGGGGDLAGAKFGTAQCGTAKLYHILPWYLRTAATVLPLPDLCTFSFHYKVPRVSIVGDIMFSVSTLFHR